MDDRPIRQAEAYADLEPFGYGAEGETAVVVFGVELALPLLVVTVLLFGWARYRLRAWRAAAVEASAATPALRPGPAVVRGTVDADPGAVVVQVTIEQLGLEHESKSSWSTTWTEIDRRTTASPFTLRLADGAALRVRPGEAPRLVDDLAKWSHIAHDRRVASATLVGGERVVARGELSVAPDPSAGYRGGETLVLGPPRGGPMELSTHGLARPARVRARRFGWWAAVVVAATMVAQLLALPYHAAARLGETREATVVARRMARGSGKKSDRFYVTLRVGPAGELVEDQVSGADHARLPEGTIVPVRVSPLETTIGPHPTISGGLVLPSALGIVALSAGALIASFRRRGWTERKLRETVEGRIAAG